MRIIFLLIIFFLTIVGCVDEKESSKEKSEKPKETEEILNEEEESVFSKVKYQVKSVYPFNEADAMEIYAYENFEIGSVSNIIEGKFFVPNQKELIKLNSNQIDKLEEILFGYVGGSFTESACYEPRHTMVFYKNGTPFTFLEICFECQGSQVYDSKNSKFDVDISDEKWTMLKDFFKSVGITYFGPHG